MQILMMFAEFTTTCPECKTDGQLFVIAATVQAAVPLSCDGFDITEATNISTSDERVRCNSCQATFDLDKVRAA